MIKLVNLQIYWRNIVKRGNYNSLVMFVNFVYDCISRGNFHTYKKHTNFTRVYLAHFAVFIN